MLDFKSEEIITRKGLSFQDSKVSNFVSKISGKASLERLETRLEPLSSKFSRIEFRGTLDLHCYLPKIKDLSID